MPIMAHMSTLDTFLVVGLILAIAGGAALVRRLQRRSR